MTPREVSPSHFPNLAATLFADRTVIALTPATNDVAWAATATWSAARAVARAGRRVGLVDLSLERPALHPDATSSTGDEGIVDAFVFGVSMGHVAHEQEQDLYFIPVGTVPTDPNEVWASERWQRLARGFQKEEALLLLFVPPAALPRLNVELDGIVVLSPTGYAPDGLVFPGIGERLKRGTPLIGVVCHERPAPRPTVSPARRSSISVPRPPKRPVVHPSVLAAVGVVGLAAVLAVALGVGSDGAAETAGAAGAAEAAAEAVGVLPRSTATSAAPASPPAPDPRDSLYYSVQVAAFSQPDQAVHYAGDFGEAQAATVSPVRLGRQGLWFRVILGALPTAGDADSLLRALWRSGRVERPNGTILRTPHAFLLGREATADAARETAKGLRERGVAAYIVPAPGGSASVLVGAFEAPDQARAADSLLRLTGLHATLADRLGTRR